MKRSQKKIVETLLESHGRTYAEEIGIKLASQTPSALFQWLCASVLFSARISTHAAVTASKALLKQGWRTPQKMAATSWKERTRVLNQSGYARYDERTSTMLGKDADLVLSKYKGDLRKLREQAGRNPKEERKLLKGFKAIGDVGVDIFFREVQGNGRKFSLSLIRGRSESPALCNWEPMKQNSPGWSGGMIFPNWWLRSCGAIWRAITRRF